MSACDAGKRSAATRCGRIASELPRQEAQVQRCRAVGQRLGIEWRWSSRPAASRAEGAASSGTGGEMEHSPAAAAAVESARARRGATAKATARRRRDGCDGGRGPAAQAASGHRSRACCGGGDGGCGEAAAAAAAAERSKLSRVQDSKPSVCPVPVIACTPCGHSARDLCTLTMYRNVQACSPGHGGERAAHRSGGSGGRRTWLAHCGRGHRTAIDGQH